jgi:hypothetical protein
LQICALKPFGDAAVPHGHWRTTAFIAGLRRSGVIAPLVLDDTNPPNSKML